MHSNAEAVAGEAVSESRRICFRFVSDQELEASDTDTGEAARKTRRCRGQKGQRPSSVVVPSCLLRR